MSQSSPFFNRWLSQVGPELVIDVLTDLVGAGAVFAVDTHGKIPFWSKGAEKLFGLTADAVLGKPCIEALGCEDAPDPCGLAEQGVIKAQSVTLKRKNGAAIICFRTARAFFDAEGQFAGALEFLQPQNATHSVISSQDVEQQMLCWHRPSVLLHLAAVGEGRLRALDGGQLGADVVLAKIVQLLLVEALAGEAQHAEWARWRRCTG